MSNFYEDIDTSQPIKIDRKQENKDIQKYQETGDLELLEKLYKQRVPTLKNWAMKHYAPGFTDSIEDFFEELSQVFVKAADKYKPGRGSFNTCLYTFLLNRIKNIKSSRYAKKRMPENYDGSPGGMMLSLDYEYSEKDGTKSTLGDYLEQEQVCEKPLPEIHNQDTLNILANGDPTLRDAFIQISQGYTISSIVEYFNTKRGHIPIDSQDSHPEEEKIHDLIKKNVGTEKFELVDLDVQSHSVKYKIIMNKTPESEAVQKRIKQLRKFRHHYMDTLGLNH